MGADFIEPDLVPTKDGVLISRHENDLTHTTNVARIAAVCRFAKLPSVLMAFPSPAGLARILRSPKLKQLKAREPLPALRPARG